MKPIRQKFEVELKFNDIPQDESNVINYNDITKKEFEVILHDFEVNENGSIIRKEVAEKALPSLKDMPIVCQYYESTNTDGENPNDGLGDHGVVLKIDRDGDLSIATNTIAVGVFTEAAFIDTIIDKDGNEKEVVKGKGVLWRSKYSDIVDLLESWWEQSLPIVSSMEILFNEYYVKDGIMSIENYIYEAHCILQSADTEDRPKVDPAYKVAEITKFQRLVANAIERENTIKQNGNKKEEDSVSTELFKKVYELSHSDIRTRLYKVLDESLGEGYWTWIVDVYDEKFIVEIGSEEGYKYYQYSYTKSEDDVVAIDFESKNEVIEERKWVSLESTQELQTQLNEANEKVSTLETQLNEASETKTTLETEKSELETQLNSKDELIKELNSFKETVETEKLEAKMAEKLEEQKSFYSTKFSALNADTKFESEEVQSLIASSLSEDETGMKAKLQLNSMLVDLVELKEEQKNKPIKEFASVTEDLIPKNTDFDSRYGI